MIKTEIAWAAGFFDGEGTVGYFEKKRMIRAQVQQTSPDGIPVVLTRFHAAVGVGTIYGPLKPAKAHWTPFWSWLCQNRAGVEQVFETLRPYLCEVKVRQFESAFDAMVAQSGRAAA